MSDATTHLLLPYILAAQAQKHVTHNEALRLLDGLVQLSVLDRDLMAPPGSPADGDRYIVASGATGDWGSRPSCCASRRGRMSWIDRPSSSTEPDWGASRRERHRSKVDFPQALAPTMAVIRPGGHDDGQIFKDQTVAVSGEKRPGFKLWKGHAEPPVRPSRMTR